LSKTRVIETPRSELREPLIGHYRGPQPRHFPRSREPFREPRANLNANGIAFPQSIVRHDSAQNPWRRGLVHSLRKRSERNSAILRRHSADDAFPSGGTIRRIFQGLEVPSADWPE
jgi:hypothetical protein